jgi:hypothetical protein
MTQEELNKQLEDVRKAYRLLYDYQSHIKDLVRFIGNQMGYYSVEGYPVFSGAAPRYGKKDIFDLWSWDWLNMYHYEFNFGTQTIGGNQLAFGIHIVSDTGYYSAESEDKTKIESFTDPRHSMTKLVLYISTGGYAWKKLQPGKDFNPSFQEGSYELGDGKRVIGKSFDLSRFHNVESTLNCIDDFRSFCEKHGINF